MRKRDPKTRCTKRRSPKCKEILRLYDKVMIAYADLLDGDQNITEYQCCVPFEDDIAGDMVTDFVATRKDGSVLIRECVLRTNLLKPRTVRLLQESQTYWRKRGIDDWMVIVDKEERQFPMNWKNSRCRSV